MSSGADRDAMGRRRRTGLRHALLRRMMAGLGTGSLTVQTPDGAVLHHDAGDGGPAAALEMHRWRALRRLLTGGDLGFAEAYMDGDWSSPDLVALIELVALNEAALAGTTTGTAPVRWLARLRHMLRPNSVAGSRRNIRQHYDLGNAFYRLWLDPAMVYSSALYAAADETLEQAQARKLARAVELLQVAPGDRVLEIGCGWGALALRLAGEGVAVTGLTLSREQAAHARARAAAEAPEGAVEIFLRDYRDEDGRYDGIVSIEMIEAVGEAYWPVFFRSLADRLKPGGRAVIQAITIAEDRFAAYRAGADFIQRHIFPGGMLPSVRAMERAAAGAGLRLARVQGFGASYARTLEDWRRRFWAARDQIAAQGFDGRFLRMWDYYLCYCAGGFRAGTIDVGFYVLTAEGEGAAPVPAA